jgi:hypothetical protein
MAWGKMNLLSNARIGLLVAILMPTLALAERKTFLVCTRKFDPPIRIKEGSGTYVYEEMRISLIQSRLTDQPYIFATEGRRPGSEEFDLGFAHIPHCSFNFESEVMVICDEYDAQGELAPYFRVVRVENSDLTFTFRMDRLRFYEPEGLTIDYAENECTLEFPAP